MIKSAILMSLVRRLKIEATFALCHSIGTSVYLRL